MNKCPIGCENFICPSNTYLDGCECKPIHPTCKTGSGPLDTNCITCADGFEKLTVRDKTYCMCKCCSIEQNYKCIPITSTYYPTDVCSKCASGQYYNIFKSGTCVCINADEIIVDGVCINPNTIICSNGLVQKNGKCVCPNLTDVVFIKKCISQSNCVAYSGVVSNGECKCPAYLAEVNGICDCPYPEGQVNFGGVCQTAIDDNCKKFDKLMLLSKDVNNRWTCVCNSIAYPVVSYASGSPKCVAKIV